MSSFCIKRCLLVGLFLFLLQGCTYPISKELRQEAQKDLTFPAVLQDPTAYVGSIVLWGGKIIETTNVSDGSEIIVLETPLDYQEVPEGERYSRGRFIAKSPKFLDPAIYTKGRKITLAGEIIGKETKPLGETDYIYPLVLIKELHLWRERRMYHEGYYPYYWQDPYHAWPYWGPWYGPYYGPSEPRERDRDRDDPDRDRHR